jgi:hypothetical protein
MKLIKKSEAIRKKEDSFQVVDVKPIEKEITQAEKLDLNGGGNRYPPAYTLGKIVGYISSFLIGFFKTQDHFKAYGPGDSYKKGNRERRQREKGKTRKRG